MNTVVELFRENNKNYTMSRDLMSKFYTCLNWKLDQKLLELTEIIDTSNPNKELQSVFPQLIGTIFASSYNNGWNLKAITYENSRYEFEDLINFLGPDGPMFRLCYKLLSDPQLKYDLPISVLPLDLQMSLERGRCPQFYSDMLVMDSQSLNVVALALNPFDYYIFNFALHLINTGQHQSTWEIWNSVYFALACDYLTHFLPSDPNVPVLPQIPNYTGKVPMAAPLQTANRSLGTPSLLLIPDLCGMANQHTSPQTQSRNEVWRSETVLQVFIDIWMSVEQFCARDVEIYQRNYSTMCSSPERVRTVRVLVKHIHSFSAKHLVDPASRSSALRKYARQVMCARAYHYVKHLVLTWPLDASFRLVMELWLSLIQPWRYTGDTINQDRFPGRNNNREEANLGSIDASYTQFIAENFPSYTCIFQLVLPRFMRLDLTAYKNAVMLFRLGKVFSQPHLVPILRNLEQAITDHAGFQQSPDTSYNGSVDDQSYAYNGVALHKWVAIAKQAISELNMSTNFEYEPIWSDGRRPFVLEFVRRVYTARLAAENNAHEIIAKLNKQNEGVWSSIKYWFLINNDNEEKLRLEESQKVPVYLNTSIQYFSHIFGLSESSLILPETEAVDASILDHSSFSNSSSFPVSVTNKLRNKSTAIQYMGDPDLMPITSYESTILVRILYQIASKFNEVYQEEFSNLWNRNDFLGYVAREVLEKPCKIRTYVKDSMHHQKVVSQELPARLSLRKLGSHAFVVWLSVGYVIFRLFSFGGFFYAFFLFTMWIIIVLSKASLKFLKNVRT